MSLVLSGCRALDKAPIDELRVSHYTESIEHNGKIYYTGVCSIRKVTDKSTLASVRVATEDLAACNGNWGMSGENFSKLRAYLKNNQ